MLLLCVQYKVQSETVIGVYTVFSETGICVCTVQSETAVGVCTVHSRVLDCYWFVCSAEFKVRLLRSVYSAD